MTKGKGLMGYSCSQFLVTKKQHFHIHALFPVSLMDGKTVFYCPGMLPVINNDLSNHIF